MSRNGASTRTGVRARLEQLGERMSQAKDDLAVARRALQAAQQAGDSDAIGLAEAAFEDAHAALETVRALEAAALRQIVGGAEPFGATLANNLEAQGALREIASSSAPLRGNVHLGPLLTMDETVGLTGRALAAPVDWPGDAGRRGAFVGIPETPARPLTLLDLFRSVPFEGRTAEIMRRLGGVAEAAIQAEGAVKQEASISYVPETLEAATVASWAKVDRQKVDDVPALMADLRLALEHGVMREVEDLLLNGDGVDLEGILTTTGVVAPVIAAATPLSDAVGQAKAQLLTTGVVANFAAAHPNLIEEEEERTGTDGHYVKTIDDQGRIRRLPLVASAALAARQVLLGDSRIGAALGVRSPVSAVVGQESDDMTRNRLTVLAEGRWAPLVTVPAAFATFTLPAAA